MKDTNFDRKSSYMQNDPIISREYDNQQYVLNQIKNLDVNGKNRLKT